MNAETIAWIVGAILGALGIGTGAGRFLGRRNVPEDQIPANIVTEKECKESRERLMNSILTTSNEIKTGLSDLSKAVVRLEEKISNIHFEFENLSMKSINQHEKEFHNWPKSNSG